MQLAFNSNRNIYAIASLLVRRVVRGGSNCCIGSVRLELLCGLRRKPHSDNVKETCRIIDTKINHKFAPSCTHFPRHLPTVQLLYNYLYNYGIERNYPNAKRCNFKG